ncbi:MAG: hypothetical protein D6780_00430, partial [Candidatus Dadabacteria bacterium]
MPPLTDGSFVGRGIADVGFEVFRIVPGDKLISLFTGSSVQLTKELAKDLFTVPTAEELFY